ncbi:PaaI family thioesterase [Lentibacter algarum]|uniref:PaaI family thioesterase n=1 Tax=Lentibacter algarum TaxID=576131 RepID=UPI001C081D76|nr:PaaI family thioesterase [Lentibacter algarum]MBU2982463.1 PaaI family thioesterase [Lentibacter algarum]
MPVVLDKTELQDFLDEVFPQLVGEFVVEHVEEMYTEIRLPVAEKHLRPGGTVSGPTMFMLADVAVYAGVLSMIGKKALAVTTSCSLDFMRKPAAGKDLLAKCTLLKLGKMLAVGDVLIYSIGEDKPVARSTMTYSIPPK